MRSPGFRPLGRAAAWEDRFWQVLEEAVPGEVRSHLRNARREILLAVRAIIDGLVDERGPRASRRGSRNSKARWGQEEGP